MTQPMTPFVGNNAPSTQSPLTVLFPEPDNPDAAVMLAQYLQDLVLKIDPAACNRNYSPPSFVFVWKFGAPQQQVLLSFTKTAKAARQFAVQHEGQAPTIFIAQTRSIIGIAQAPQPTLKLRFCFYANPRYSQGRAEMLEMTDDGQVKHSLSLGSWQQMFAGLLRALQNTFCTLNPRQPDAVMHIARAINALEH